MDVQIETDSDVYILKLLHECVNPLKYTHMLPIVACAHSLHGMIYILLINQCTRRYRVRRRLQQVDEARDRAGLRNFHLVLPDHDIVFSYFTIIMYVPTTEVTARYPDSVDKHIRMTQFVHWSKDSQCMHYRTHTMCCVYVDCSHYVT